jgi:hypothetical protein
MPIYAMQCPCGHTEDIYRSIAKMNDDLPAHCSATMTRRIVAPMVANDLAPYRSMCDGSMITSRSQHRAHLKQHGVIEIGNEKITPPKPLAPRGLKESIIKVAYEKLKHV